jgi:hypothetical protein
MSERCELSRRRVAVAIAICLLTAVRGKAASVVTTVSTTRTSMNPSLGESMQLTVGLAKAGAVTIHIIDRDGFPVRMLASALEAAQGENRWSWDGRDESGQIVPDEAYSFHVEWSRGAEREIYFPANAPAHLTAVDAEYYSPRSGTIVYTLPVASRVHLQAGVASKNPKSGVMEGPVMKTVVNREPRAAGRIAEAWSGFDESGLVKIADLRDFVLAVATMPLPANSIITYGNRQRAFAESALTRKGRTFFSSMNKGSHHAGLTVLEDISPAMRIEPLNATWSAEHRAWIVKERALRLRVSLTGPSAATFAAQKGQLQHFVDGKLISKMSRPASYPAIVEIRLPPANGIRSVSLNWQSEFGAVAANTIQVKGVGR